MSMKVKSLKMKASGCWGTLKMFGEVSRTVWLSWHHSLLRAPVTRPKMIQSRIAESRVSGADNLEAFSISWNILS